MRDRHCFDDETWRLSRMLRYPRQRLARPSPPVPVARQRLVLRHYMLTDRATCLHLLDEAKTMPVVQARTHRDRAMRPQLSRTPRHQPLATPPPPTLPLSSQKLGPTERVTRTSVTGMGSALAAVLASSCTLADRETCQLSGSLSHCSSPEAPCPLSLCILPCH